MSRAQSLLSLGLRICRAYQDNSFCTMSLSDYSSDSDGEASILHGDMQDARAAATRDRRGDEDDTSVSNYCRNFHVARAPQTGLSVSMGARCTSPVAQLIR